VRRPLLLLVLVIATVASATGQPAYGAVAVSCGQLITSDTTLANDLVDCPRDGLVIGRDGITVDLNGHTITGQFEGGDFCETNCVYGRHGIDDSGGYDRITIRNGTINQFTHGIFLFNTHGSRVENITYLGIGTQSYDRSGVFLARSKNNLIRNVAIHRAEPGILLFDSDRNTIASSASSGGTSMRQGDGMLVAAGSDSNWIVDTHLSGDWLALDVQGSNGNHFARIDTASYVGSNLYGSRNTIVDSQLSGGKQNAMNITGDRNRLERNQVTGEGGLIVAGARNRLESNTVLGTAFGALVVLSGDRNIVRGNKVPSSSTIGTGRYPLHVQSPATRTRVLGNYVTRADRDGILIEAAGTIVGDNTANDNLNLGINAVAGVIDAGRNRASGNGNPLQCVNVFCQPAVP
jgi:parallel beta-helix repeat protein